MRWAPQASWMGAPEIPRWAPNAPFDRVGTPVIPNGHPKDPRWALVAPQIGTPNWVGILGIQDGCPKDPRQDWHLEYPIWEPRGSQLGTQSTLKGAPGHPSTPYIPAGHPEHPKGVSPPDRPPWRSQTGPHGSQLGTQSTPERLPDHHAEAPGASPKGALICWVPPAPQGAP